MGCLRGTMEGIKLDVLSGSPYSPGKMGRVWTNHNMLSATELGMRLCAWPNRTGEQREDLLASSLLLWIG